MCWVANERPERRLRAAQLRDESHTVCRGSYRGRLGGYGRVLLWQWSGWFQLLLPSGNCCCVPQARSTRRMRSVMRKRGGPDSDSSAADGRGDAIGRVISGQLEQRLVGVTDQGQAQDLRATAEDVASLIGGLANDNEAVRVAAAHPDQFLAYAKQRSDQLRRSTSTAATPLFDRILEAAAAEFVELAPSSRRFMSAGLAEVLRLAETLPDIHEYARRAAENSEQVLAVVLREQRAGAGEARVNSLDRS